MALPTLAKTWEISANNRYTSQGSTSLCYKNFWYNLVQWLKTKGWVVQAASNATVASTTTDWTSIASLKNGSSGATGPYQIPNSWIVLRNSAIGPTFDLCIQLAATNNNSATDFYPTAAQIAVSPGGYNVSGTLSTIFRPSTSSSDENVIYNIDISNTGIWGNSDQTIVWHGWSSTDRECTRFAIYYNDNLVGLCILDKASEPVTGWSVPYVASFLKGNGSSVTPFGYFSNVGSNANGYAVTRANNTNIGVFLSGEGYTSGLLSNALSVPNDITGEYPMIPMGIVSTTAPARGRHGGIFDAWYSVIASNGSTISDANGNPKKFVFNNGLVLPWDGSTPITR